MSVFIGISVMVVHNEYESGICLGLIVHGSLDMKGIDLYELVDLKLLKTLFKLMPI